MAVNHRVATLTNAQSTELGLALSAAFFDEPNFTYLLPNPIRRRAALPWFFGTFIVQIALRHGIVYTNETTDGGAIWMQPGARVTFRSTLQAGGLTMPLWFGWPGFRRSLHLSGTLEGMRQRTTPEPHWYLMALGVAPSKQGNGLGSALLEPILSRADTDRLPCYLETFKERVVQFYAKHGFVVIAREQIAHGGPDFWTMVREPRTEGGGTSTSPSG